MYKIIVTSKSLDYYVDMEFNNANFNNENVLTNNCNISLFFDFQSC